MTLPRRQPSDRWRAAPEERNLGDNLRCVDVGLRIPRMPGWLIRDLAVSWRSGEVVAVVGPNGAGKSTLLRALTGLASPVVGEVRLNDATYDAWPRRDRSRALAYLPQRPDLPHDMLVERVVALGRLPHLSWHGAYGPRDREAVARALADCEIEHLRGRGMLTLSGGEVQRVMLARMLCTQARVFVLDEPTTALDLRHTFALLELLRGVADAGRLVVLSMHEIDLARRVADRVLCLHGDASGAFTFGPAHEVVRPELIQRVFAIDVRLEAGVLVFGEDRLGRRGPSH
ncbi:MAG: ABC transporter ATP-binding protein [Myxococcales bacterium FL481]|nr:MAG: ABC transporter ATP-binding protein [Myxococcales bacterium FL481]